jgi:hypothetical protein
MEWACKIVAWSDLDFLRQRRFRVPRSRAEGMNIVVRWDRLKRVDARIAAESGVPRGCVKVKDRLGDQRGGE